MTSTTVPALPTFAATLHRLSLQGQLQRLLDESPYRPLRDLRCSCDTEGVVNLEGDLPSYHLKQVAQTVAMQVDGVTRVHNRIAVQDSHGK